MTQRRKILLGLAVVILLSAVGFWAAAIRPSFTTKPAGPCYVSPPASYCPTYTPAEK